MWYRDQIISRMERRDVYADSMGQVRANKYWYITHKFGIEVPNTVEDAVEINHKMGTDFW